MSECAKLEKLCKDAVLKYGPIEEGDERVYEQTLAGVLNAPRANEYATSSQGVRLHTRTDWQTSFEQLGLPSDFSKKGRFVPDSSPRSPTKTKGIILLIHGLGGHSNKLPWTYYAHHMYQQGYHPVSFDFHAHGWTGDFYPGMYQRIDMLICSCLELWLYLCSIVALGSPGISPSCSIMTITISLHNIIILIITHQSISTPEY